MSKKDKCVLRVPNESEFNDDLHEGHYRGFGRQTWWCCGVRHHKDKRCSCGESYD